METIELKHPAGKKAINMAATKYEPMKESILHSLRNGPLTHNELVQSVNAYFTTNNIKFDGAINWHVEWVKLDLEARNVIKRAGAKSPFRYEIIIYIQPGKRKVKIIGNGHWN